MKKSEKKVPTFLLTHENLFLYNSSFFWWFHQSFHHGYTHPSSRVKIIKLYVNLISLIEPTIHLTQNSDFYHDNIFIWKCWVIFMKSISWINIASTLIWNLLISIQHSSWFQAAHSPCELKLIKKKIIVQCWSNIY